MVKSLFGGEEGGGGVGAMVKSLFGGEEGGELWLNHCLVERRGGGAMVKSLFGEGGESGRRVIYQLYCFSLSGYSHNFSVFDNPVLLTNPHKI